LFQQLNYKITQPYGMRQQNIPQGGGKVFNEDEE